MAPELEKKISPENLRMKFGKFRTLGNLEKYSKPKGESKMNFIFGKNKSVTAYYIVNATFDNAPAIIKIYIKKSKRLSNGLQQSAAVD